MTQDRRIRIIPALALIGALLGAGSAAAVAPFDPLTPTLGNAGYDTLHVALALDLDVPDGEIDRATATIEAVTTAALDAIRFDFRDGLIVDELRLDGEAAEWIHRDDDLVITPPAPLDPGAAFEVEVRYHGKPGEHPDPYERGWWADGSSIFIVGEPGGSEAWFPVNNHPSDAATYTLELTAPKDVTVVAGGAPGAPRETGALRTTRWTHDDPIPAYLLTFAAGKFDVERSFTPDGIDLTYAWPPDLSPAQQATFDAVPEMLEVFTSLFGPYPGERFGGVVVDDFGAALETEEMVIFGRGALNEETIAHELAHHWFGNSVHLETWSDIWLNEGFARYSEILWIEHRDGPAARDAALATQARAVERLDALPGERPPIGTPTSDSLFEGDTYNRGALALHALRGELGDDAFFRLLRAWSDRFAGKPAGTAAFIALANEISGRDLTAFFDAWLFRSTLPTPLLAAER